MQTDARKFISILTPVLLHQAVSLAVAFLFQTCADQYALRYDATLAVLVGNLLVIPIAVLMYRRDRQNMAPSGTDMSDGRPVSGKWFGFLCFIAGAVLNVVWSSVLNRLQIQEHFSNQVQEQLLSAVLPVQLIGLGVVAPVAEELIFRGLTYRRMRRMFPKWAAVVLSALLFAVYHGNPIQMIFAFPMAVVLALIYEHGKLFIFPVLFHMGSNLAAIILEIL